MKQLRLGGEESSNNKQRKGRLQEVNTSTWMFKLMWNCLVFWMNDVVLRFPCLICYRFMIMILCSLSLLECLKTKYALTINFIYHNTTLIKNQYHHALITVLIQSSWPSQSSSSFFLRLQLSWPSQSFTQQSIFLDSNPNFIIIFSQKDYLVVLNLKWVLPSGPMLGWERSSWIWRPKV